MVVTCDHCGSRYKLADHKITGRGAKITCPSCRHVFVVYRDAAGSSAKGGAAAASPSKAAPPAAGSGGGGFSVTFVEGNAAVESQPAEVLRADALDYAKVGIQAWKVKVRIGLVYDFNDLGTLRKYIADGRVTEHDLLSHDGQSWVSIGEIPDLEAHFVGIYKAARDALAAPSAPAAREQEAERTETPVRNEFADENPTNIVGLGDVGLGLAKGAPSSAPESGGLPLEKPRKKVSKSASAASATGNAEAQGPRFVDPFEAMRAEKRQASKRRKKKQSPGGLADGGGGASSRVPRSGLPDVRPSKAEPKGGSGGRIAAVVLALIVVGGGGLYAAGVLTPSAAVSNPQPPGPLAGTQPGKAPAEQAHTNELIERVTSIPVEAREKPSWEVEEKPEMQAIIPAEFRGPRASSATPGAMTKVSSGGVEARPATASDHGATGDSAAAQGDWGTAITAYSTAVTMDPGNPVWREKLGVAQWRSGDAATAKVTLSQASRSGALGADKYLGHIARDQGDVAGAVARYNNYLQSNPSDAAEIKRQIAALTQG